MWVNSEQFNYTFDANGHETSLLYQSWNGSELDNSVLFSYTFDSNGNLTSQLYQTWNGSTLVNNTQVIYIIQQVTGVIGARQLPIQFILSQNYPNPFNPTTQISYTLPKASTVTLTVYDILGQQRAMLVNEKQEAGEHSVSWNALNIPSGVYFYRIVAGNFVQTKKMVLMK